jgi:hypothetical protein
MACHASVLSVSYEAKTVIVIGRALRPMPRKPTCQKRIDDGPSLHFL